MHIVPFDRNNVQVKLAAVATFLSRARCSHGRRKCKAQDGRQDKTWSLFSDRGKRVSLAFLGSGIETGLTFNYGGQ